jgi:hypothetical protein
VSEAWLYFLVSIGNEFKVVSEPPALSKLCGVVIARAAVALELLIDLPMGEKLELLRSLILGDLACHHSRII